MITDDMVEKALEHFYGAPASVIGNNSMRRALEAVAPMLIAPLQQEIQTLRNYGVTMAEENERLRLDKQGGVYGRFLMFPPRTGA